tara:strand:+ start:3436 stop:3621 length:186 start_codon:yes stop_codon:yes gene_type:complete
MTRPTTEQLKKELKEFVDQHNKAIDVIQACKQKIIALQAVIKDRESEDGDTDNSNPDSTES